MGIAAGIWFDSEPMLKLPQVLPEAVAVVNEGGKESAPLQHGAAEAARAAAACICTAHCMRHAFLEFRADFKK